jgi:DNA polymerase
MPLQYTILDFEQWRSVARDLRLRGTSPAEVQFFTPGETGLFVTTNVADIAANPPPQVSSFRVPKDFLELAENVGYHREPKRWDLLYRVLWRLTHDEPRLLQVHTDDDMHRLSMMEKAVCRDAHKMKAFVRFREVIQESEKHYIAWHRPDHFVLRKIAPFFSRRFKAMNWTILTQDESVSWDQRELKYFQGVDRSEAPSADDLEDLWRTYYANIFNPARIKIKAMKTEMPVRHWSTLPETTIIDQMLKDAPARVADMIARSEGFDRSARDYMPDPSQPLSLPQLSDAIKQCRACDLHCHATQAVFGHGPVDARIVIVGEQPGDSEDIEGKPFVGPAGEILNRALAEAGIDRTQLYVTNTVKHFKFDRNGKQRLHKKPNSREIRACLPWFEAEWSQLQATTLVCLGATAATALISPGFRLQQQRGQWIESKYTPRTLATWHPSFILRLPTQSQRESRMEELISDLRKITRRE